MNVIHAKKVKVLDVRGSYAQEDKLTSPTYCTKFFIFMRESFCNVLVRYSQHDQIELQRDRYFLNVNYFFKTGNHQ